MENHNRTLRRGNCQSPTDPALLRDPLEFIQEDHLRERQICASLHRIAGGQNADRELIPDMLRFLEVALPLHVRDEEADLFPLLRRRCEQEDDIGKVIDQLNREHRHAGKDTSEVVEILKSLETGDRALTDQERVALTEYAARARRHLVLEDAIILPFAKLRLTKNDTETLRLRMLQRRGLD